MSIASASPSTARACPPQDANRGTAWLLNPTLDLLFIANLIWPLIVAFSVYFGQTVANQALGFLLVYFVILPHRWITLPLVFCDRKRFATRRRAFLAILLAAVATTCAVQLTMRSLAILVAIDYIWNAWHFAAQHSGIYRIYGRMGHSDRPTSGRAEKYLLRAFLLYTIVRMLEMFVPADSSPWLNAFETAMAQLRWCDWIALALPAGLLLREVRQFGRKSLACGAYFVSLYSLYTTMLMAIHFGLRPLAVGCGAAATLFHSSEYLGIVSWHAQNRLRDNGIFRRLVPRWGLSLLAFMAFFVFTAWLLDLEGTRQTLQANAAASSATASNSLAAGLAAIPSDAISGKEKVLRLWILINMVVSFLHYAYDGMIWKRPKKKSQ